MKTQKCKTSCPQTKEYSYEGVCTTLAHTISFWYRGTRRINPRIKTLLLAEAIDRARTSIINGYVEGELKSDQGTASYTGWWKILR